MRRGICGECDTPINDDGSCICTELLKRGWRQCAKGQQTTQWCAMAETLLREQRQRDEALLRQALEALGRYCKRPKGADFTMEVEEFRLYATEVVMGLPAPANRAGLRAGLIEPTRSFAIAAQQARR